MPGASPSLRAALHHLADACCRDDGGRDPLLADARPVVRRPRGLVLVGQVLGVAAVFLILLVVVWAVQASSEELLFQDELLPKVARTYGLVIGVAVAALAFTVLHLGNPGFEVLGVINLALCGVFAAAGARYQGSIAGIVGFHAAWNLSQAQVFRFAVSGGEVGEVLAPVSLLTMELTGPARLVGSGFGPEAGLLTTLAIQAGLAVLLVLLRRRTAAAAVTVDRVRQPGSMDVD